MRFYLIAMIFIVFDIEIIFLYPFAMVFRELGGFGLGGHRRSSPPPCSSRSST